MNSNRIKHIFKIAWKWITFSAWLVWFFLTFPWQIKKGYNQFINATTLEVPRSRKGSKMLVDISPKIYDNLN
jgi:hypothetical protein